MVECIIIKVGWIMFFYIRLYVNLYVNEKIMKELLIKDGKKMQIRFYCLQIVEMVFRLSVVNRWCVIGIFIQKSIEGNSLQILLYLLCNLLVYILFT